MDALLHAADTALRTLFARPQATQASPARDLPDPELPADSNRLAGALMRVNHVGEVCAQALYTAQAITTRDPELRQHLMDAAREEMNHLAWTQERLDELGARPSLLNPLWFAGAFAIGCVASRIGDPVNLGFVVETERQVAEHLDGHLERLPEEDVRSRAIVAQMKSDEERHAQEARDAGAVDFPPFAQGLMRMAAKVMTTTAHRI